MSNAILKASAGASRSYLAAKASVSQAVDAILTPGPAGLPIHQPDLSRAQEQYRHNRGWVYACVRAIAQRIAAQSIRVGRPSPTPKRVKGGLPDGVEALDDHPLLRLLRDPSDLFVAWTLSYTTVASLLLTGRCVWWLPPGKKMILPLPTHWLAGGYEGSTRIESWTVRPPYSGEQFKVPADETVHFFLPDPSDPHAALSPLQAAAVSVTLDEQIQLSQLSAFKRGMFPSHALIVGKTHPDGSRPRLTDAQQRQLIAAVQKRYAGVVNAGEPLILDSIIDDIKTLSTSPAEMHWLESGKECRDRILLAFGVPLYVLGGSEPGSRAASAVAEEHFLRTTVNPLIQLMSQSLTEWLNPQFGPGLTVWIEPATSNDPELTLKQWQVALQAGAVTGNEFRSAVLGLPDAPFAKQPPAQPSESEKLRQTLDELRDFNSLMKSFDPDGLQRGAEGLGHRIGEQTWRGVSLNGHK